MTSPETDPLQAEKDALAEAAMTHAAFDGWTGAALAAGARELGKAPEEAERLFPGGAVEPGDAGAVAAAVREAVEEIGLLPALVAPLGVLPPLCTITGFRVVPVVATIAPDYVADPDPAEVDEAFEVPLAFLLEPANLATLELDYAGRPRRVLEFVNRDGPGRRIWGATASILFNLRERMAAAAP